MKNTPEKTLPSRLFVMTDTSGCEGGCGEFITCRHPKEGLTAYVKEDVVEKQLVQNKVDIDFLKEDRARYASYHQTEKTMRIAAESDVSKFKKIFGRIYWKRGK